MRIGRGCLVRLYDLSFWYNPFFINDFGGLPKMGNYSEEQIHASGKGHKQERIPERT